MMGVLIGIDGGGTKTICLVEDESGQVVGKSISGPANYHKIGIYAAKNSLRSAVENALKEAGTGKHEVMGLCAGIAGVYREKDREVMARVFGEIIAVDHLVLESDAFVTLIGATGAEPGAVVIAGTGSIAFGVNSRGERARAGGWGYLLGDEGSGYDLARNGLVAALRDHDGRGKPTILRDRLVRELYLKSIEDVVPLVYGGQLGQRNLGDLCPLVLEAAQEGDQVSVELLERAGDELAEAAAAVIEKLVGPKELLPVAISGGAFKHSFLLRDAFQESLKKRTSRARLIQPRHPPERGALMVIRALAEGRTLFSAVRS